MSKTHIEENRELSLEFDTSGLLPAIVQEENTGDVLMLAWVNKQAFNETLETGFATFWSRSRKQLWKKGESSGNMMKIVDILVDCDQDCLIYKVEKTQGGACHTKNNRGNFRNSCFYRKIDLKTNKLKFLEE
jgi:phosphoribosyl-AMP cyclohydrolase